MLWRGKNHAYRLPHKLIAVLITGVLFLLGPCVTLISVRADIAAPSVVKVGYYENEVFQEGAGEGLVKSGYAYEYYMKLSEYTGWKYEYTYGSYTELYQMLLDGKIDLLAGLAWKEERRDLIAYPDEPMGHETYSLLKHDSDGHITANPASLNGLKFGVFNSAMVDVLRRYMTKNNIQAEIVTYDDYEKLFNDFDAKKLDILAAESDGAYGRSHTEVLCSFGASDYFLCVNKQRSDLLSELNTAQSQLAEEEPSYLVDLDSKYYSVSISGRALSGTEKEWLDTHDTLHVGYIDDFLPYSDKDEQGEATGFITDYIPAILSKLDISVNITYHGYNNYDDIITDMSAGAIDVMFPVGGGLYYAEENGLYQSRPVFSSAPDLVYADEKQAEKAESFAVSKNNRVQYNSVKTRFPNAKIRFYSNTEQCLDAVKNGEVDCALLNSIRSNRILRNTPYEGLSVRELSGNDDLCFGVEIGNAGLLKILNRGIHLAGSDYAQNVAYRYLDGLYRYTIADMLHDHWVSFIVGAVIIIAMIIILLAYNLVRGRKDARETENAKRKLEEKNKELDESRRALSEALVAAEQANRAKTAFLSNMSHDIRTPMNAIVGFTALASAHIDNKEQVQNYLSKITVSGRHLLSLINDVLDMSRIESGKMHLSESEVHLPELIHEIRSIIYSSVTDKNLTLTVQTQDVIHEDILIDKLRLNQVLLNILNNAVKFTPSGGSVSFTIIEQAMASEETACFEFRIKDTGIGMSKEFQKTIFEAFSRERTSTVSGIQGTGLGMAITKSFVDLMGGTITVNSEEGKGSEFVVDLPCRICGASAETETIPELEGQRALVVGDSTETCRSVCAMLERIGMRSDRTDSAASETCAKEAREQGDAYMVYVIDRTASDVNVIETVRAIRRLADNAEVILLTAYDWADVEEEARAAGVNAFCAKPLFMSELRTALMQPRTTSTPAEKTEEETPDFSGKRVLLAEDNEMNIMIAQSVLEQVGFTVEVATNGAIAVEMVTNAAAGYYDVILMDVQMPKMDGYEATARIRSLEDSEKAGIPIVAVTANAFEEDRQQALKAGMNCHLAKPYDIPVMLDTLKKLVF